MIDERLVRERLDEIRPPGVGASVLAAGWVRDLQIEGARVVVRLAPGNRPPGIVRATVEEIRRAVGSLPEVAEVDVHVAAPEMPRPQPLPGVRDVVAVSSTKGGVGKSTVAVNLACAMAAIGRKVGLLDADVYGPSLPIMMGIDERPRVTRDDRVIPLERHGVRVMSMGFFLDDSAPVIWRGPLVTGLLRQFLNDVEWGDLDVLLIDLPPGTGDAQITLVQLVPLAGAVVVTTPQPVSLLDVERGMAMFRHVHTPILGVIENMSAFECPHCGNRDELFGSGGGERLARTFGVELLAKIPLVPEVRELGDRGTPLVVAKPGHPVALAYEEAARRVLAGVEATREERQAPRIL